jgi:hypothetical protein
MRTLVKLTKSIAAGAALLVSTHVLPASAAPSHPAPGASAEAWLERSGTLIVAYKGMIVDGMAQFLEQKFQQHAEATRKVVLVIHSEGGRVDAGEHTIQVLRRIKQTHLLATVVLPGMTCASMCVPIYLQGHERHAARSSIWLFHEASKRQRNGAALLDREETLRLFRRYFVPAGVSIDWLNAVLRSIERAELWQTGQELIRGRTGIITHAIENRQARTVAGADRTVEANGQAPNRR